MNNIQILHWSRNHALFLYDKLGCQNIRILLTINWSYSPFRVSISCCGLKSIDACFTEQIKYNIERDAANRSMEEFQSMLRPPNAFYLAVNHKRVIIPFNYENKCPDLIWHWKDRCFRDNAQRSSYSTLYNFNTKNWICCTTQSLKSQGWIMFIKSSVGFKVQKTRLLHNTCFSCLELKAYLRPVSRKYPSTGPILLCFLKLFGFSFEWFIKPQTKNSFLKRVTQEIRTSDSSHAQSRRQRCWCKEIETTLFRLAFCLCLHTGHVCFRCYLFPL